MALRLPKEPNEWPPSVVTVMRQRLEPTASLTTVFKPPSMAYSREMRPSKSCISRRTPLRLPSPSSPELSTKRMPVFGLSLRSMAMAAISMTATALVVSSPMPGA